MRKMIDNPLVTLAFRLAVGGIFLAAAYSKIVDPSAFAKAVNNYHILPGSLVNIFAITLPWVEVLVALGILFGIWRYASSILVNMMMVSFTIALLIAIANGVDINCGCFTQNPEVKGSLWVSFVRDIGFLVLTVPLLFSRARGFGWGESN